MGEPSDTFKFADRIRFWARHHAAEGKRRPQPGLPTTNPTTSDTSFRDAQRSPDGPPAHIQLDGHSIGTKNAVYNGGTSTAVPFAGPPSFIKSTNEGASNSALEEQPAVGMYTRFKNGSKRFGLHTKDALLHSYINVLLVFVPLGIALAAAKVHPAIIFAMNAIAIIPLAGLLSHATESVASRLGDTLGALLNVSFGNAVELIIFIIALVKDQITIVQASLLGSILSNLLLILGMAFLCGGLRYQEQIYNSTVTQMSACLLSLSVTSLLLPTAFHASFADTTDADQATLKISRGTSVVLLIVYVLYLLFQLKSHAYMYESTPQQIIDEESHPGILTEMFASSSSSDGSDSSSNDTDSDTSGSRTTTKRIKRAFRHRRRRKSSASSTTAPSIPSVLSSFSGEHPEGFGDSPSAQTSSPTRRASFLGAITSGDEADTDGEVEQYGTNPRVIDFVDTIKVDAIGAKDRKRDKKHKKKQRKHRSNDEKGEDFDEGSSIRKQGKKPIGAPLSRPRVGFVDNVQTVDPESGLSEKKTFGMRSARQSLRPALPKMLSNNVFISSPPVSGPPCATPSTLPRNGVSSLRRTSSLPDRLNRQGTPVQNQREPLPPYQRPLAAVVADGDTCDEENEKAPMSRTSATVMLLVATALVAVCAEFMVEAIPKMIDTTPVSQAFIGLIILPIVANAAEHVTAVTVATKNKMDLAIGVSVGSSIQIALFVTPLVVLLGWMMQKEMTLYFNLFETISLFVTAFVVNFLVLDGRSNYLEGSLLIAAYVIIAVAAFFYPETSGQSTLGGAGHS